MDAGRSQNTCMHLASLCARAKQNPETRWSTLEGEELHLFGTADCDLYNFGYKKGGEELYFSKFRSASSLFPGHEASLAGAFPARTAAHIATMSFFDQLPQVLAQNRGL